MQTRAHSGEVIRRIVERSDLDRFAESVLASFWDRPEFKRLHPPRDAVLAWVRWNIDLVVRWLVDGQPPTEAELADFREKATARAAEGFPVDVVPANFRLGARFAWSALLDAATDEERPALLDSADLLFDYVDRVSRIFSDAYEEAAGTPPVSDEERRARALLDRLARDEELIAEDHQVAEQVGLEVRGAYRPFAVVSPQLSARRHADLAARLRAHGALATSEGRRVTGVTLRRPPWSEVGVGPASIVAAAPLTPRRELAEALEELRIVVEVAESRGHVGRVAIDDYLPELLLRRSPRVASRICARVYGPLDREHPELARTLDLLVEHDFDRAASAAALPAHRNTLNNRLARIRDVTGVDVDSASGRALAWLAWLERKGRVAARGGDVTNE